jgi:hypothetical protein
MNSVFICGADQKQVSGWVKEIVISAVNTKLFGLNVRNKSASTFHVQVFDLASATGADATTPDYDEPVYAGGSLPFAFSGGYPFHKGIYCRCVTAPGGAATDLIAASDAKFTSARTDGPILN